MTHDLIAETVTITGHGGDPIEAYLAQPTDVDEVGSIVVIHHMPGYDEATKEICRRFAANGYLALMPNLYHREAPGAEPDDAAAAARANGGVPDERLVGDVKGAMEHLKSLPTSNGKVASIGYCSGGRQSFLAGCRLPLDAVIDCYGAFVVGSPPEGMPLKVTAVVDQAPNLSAPLLGLFGADDQYPSPEQTDELAAGAHRRRARSSTSTPTTAPGTRSSRSTGPAIDRVAANEGWDEIFAFLGRTIA